MKKHLLISILVGGYTACFAQLTHPSATPRYATGGSTGASINYGYIEYADSAKPGKVKIPASGIINVSLNKTFTTIVFDSVPRDLVIQVDTTGFAHNTQWIKPNPFYNNWQGDQVTFIFRGSKIGWHHVTWGAYFWNNLTNDTLSVPNATLNGGGASATFMYNYSAGGNVMQTYSNW